MMQNYSALPIVERNWRNAFSLPASPSWIFTNPLSQLSMSRDFLVVLPLVFFGLSLWSTVTVASTDDEIQVYNNAINAPGQFGLEIHTNYVPKGTLDPAYDGDAPSQGAFRETSEFSYGLTDNWELGAYLPVLSQGSITRLEGGKLRVKFLQQEDNGFYYGFNTEIGHTTKRSNEQPWNQELRPIVGYHGEDWRVAFNPVLGWSLVGRDAFLPTFSPMLKVGRAVMDNLVLGVEHFVDLGMIHKVESLQHQGQNTYLVMDTTVANVNVNFGAGYGWTQDADGWTIKMILGLPFNQMVNSLFQ
jgi:hypothetical protein